MARCSFSAFLLLFLFSGILKAENPWKDSPHGPMLERIIPPGFTAAMLPEPDSRGARLTLRYCVQCHNLANPAMHDAKKWPAVVERIEATNLGGRTVTVSIGVSSYPDHG